MVPRGGGGGGGVTRSNAKFILGFPIHLNTILNKKEIPLTLLEHNLMKTNRENNCLYIYTYIYMRLKRVP